MINSKSKKLVALALVATMMASMCGCSKKEKETTTEETTTVNVSTATEEEKNDDIFADISTEEIILESTENPDSEEAVAEQERFSAYLDEQFAESVTSDSLTLHYTLAYPEEYGIERIEPTYGDIDMSDEAMENGKKEDEAELATLEAFNYDLLTYDQKFTYKLLKQEIENNIESYDYVYLMEPFAYIGGLQSNLPINLSEYKFYCKQDVDDYLKLLELTPDYFNECLKFEKVKARKGNFMPELSAKEVINQCNEFIKEPENNMLLSTFENKINKLEGISDEEKEAYIQANHDAVINYIIPAYSDTIKTFTQLLSKSKNQYGIANLEGGKDYYKYILKSEVGTSKSPEDIIDIVDKELSNLINDMTTIAMTNYKEYMSYADNYGNIFSDDLDPVETIRFLEKQTSDIFPKLDDYNFSVTPVHESLKDIVSPAFFMIPPLDDYDVNYIYTNLDSDGAGGIWNTLAHEGVPGHMYQFVYFMQSNPEPIRKLLSYSGYSEGWATYVEMMSFDYYEDYEYECFADLSRIDTKLNLLLCSRVDLGIHYEGWNLEDLKEYLAGLGFDDSIAEDLLIAMLTDPGNYLNYCLGWLEFEQLRQHAENELGDKFNEKDFHKALLDAGPSPFNLVAQYVEQYISDNQ